MWELLESVVQFHFLHFQHPSFKDWIRLVWPDDHLEVPLVLAYLLAWVFVHLQVLSYGNGEVRLNRKGYVHSYGNGEVRLNRKGYVHSYGKFRFEGQN